MRKGINTVIEDTKSELVHLINTKLELGLPISVLGLMIENISAQIKMETIKTIDKEKIEETKQASEEN